MGAKSEEKRRVYASLAGRNGRSMFKPVGMTLAVSVLLAPMSVMMPSAPASAHESAVEGARVATRDLAVTEKNLEQISAPEEYLSGEETRASALISGDADAALTQTESGTKDGSREEVSLARALVSSPTAILGVTFPLNNVDETVTISYRTRLGEDWTDWAQMELADAGSAPSYAQTVTLGTEPVPLTDTEEVEVAVRTEDGQALPGAQLTVIEPELSADELSDAQVDVHGQKAVDAVESLIDDKVDDGSSVKSEALQPSIQPAGSSDSVTTPAEEAEQNSSLEVSYSTTAGSMGGAGVLGVVRAVGLSTDGRSYVTDLPGLSITTRKGWGADESVMDWKPEKVTFKGAVVHHTAGSNNYTKAQVPGIVRGVYRYHAVSLGWGDVGYHLLVDKFGGVWEGRAGGLTNSVEGGHAFGANTTTFGISVLGDYMEVKPSDEAIDAVAKAVAWKLKVHKITNLDATFTTKGKQWGKTSIQLPIVSAHRHVGGTTCPGDAFMTRWDELQAKVKYYSKELQHKQGGQPNASHRPESQKQIAWHNPVGVGYGWNSGRALSAGAFSAQGRTDAILIDAWGKMWLYPGVDNGRFIFGRTQIGHGWKNLDQISAGIDFDGDSHPDVIARHKSTARLLLYSGNGHGGFKSSRQIGQGWNGFEDIYLLPDAYSGKPVVYGVHPDGLMRAYPTDGRGSITQMVRVGTGWDNMRGLSGIGDVTGNGAGDMFAVDQLGRAWVYEGDNRGKHKRRIQVASDWQQYEQIRSTGNKGHIWTVSSTGYLTHHQLKPSK